MRGHKIHSFYFEIIKRIIHDIIMAQFCSTLNGKWKEKWETEQDREREQEFNSLFAHFALCEKMLFRWFGLLAFHFSRFVSFISKFVLPSEWRMATGNGWFAAVDSVFLSHVHIHLVSHSLTYSLAFSSPASIWVS